MLLTSLTRKAFEIASKAHAGQVDKAGIPYIEHPLHVAKAMNTENEVCTALLHDVIEDTDYTFDDLRIEGFSEEVIEALRLLTHKPGDTYMDYICAIKSNPLATKVKIADLYHNSDLTRLPNVTQADGKRVKKYAEALALLEE